MKPKALTTRRLFFWKAGAALSAPLAVATAAGPAAAAEDVGAMKARLALLEDMDAIRDLNRRYTRHLNAADHEALAALFAEPADAPAGGSIRALTADVDRPDVVEIAADHRTATARIPCTVQIETPIGPACPLVEMAALQGGGVVKRTETGLLENAYAKQSGVWKIRRSTYRPEEPVESAAGRA